MLAPFRSVVTVNPSRAARRRGSARRRFKPGWPGLLCAAVLALLAATAALPVAAMGSAAMGGAAQAVAAEGAGTGDIAWVTGSGPEAEVHLYFFWSKSCPHCREALPQIERMDAELPWLRLHTHELTASRASVALYVDMAEQLGRDARSVPAFFICERMLTGWDDADGMGAQIRRLAELCRPAASANGPAAASGPAAGAGNATGAGAGAGAGGASGGGLFPEAAAGPLSVPVLGNVDAERLSLPVFTLVLAGLDAFNPCAFFVLLFLLSLMVHARSRARMLLVGGTFVFFSGLVYFLFMAAWLNLFLVVGGAPVVTVIAGLVAVLIGVLNVKDFFRLRAGPSLSIPEGAKPGLYQRVRGLLNAEHLGTMLFGTVALALAANSYELLCTAGFPMVYTRVLTLQALSGWTYYAYLALYNLIYVLPLAAIVLVFTFTLGARKLSEREGRVLKLLSGVMMLGLGLTMLLRPDALGNPTIGVALLAAALLVTAAALWLTRRSPVGA
ncbi:thioredoxin family protein [uncultured Thiohalocapsa sp.]|uniref:TlpA family protein disulfide reductase n=1 Tax=uncultured Thiohalocapsa sp. TaxID=768990 RepID=UPI0025FC6808|nr:thioredoxin family protein [uncultured Thiohalocapsa sp.]